LARDVRTADFLDGEGEETRLRIARRVGEMLSADDLPAAERLAAEALARDLVGDVIESVRRELSKAIRHARYLPREIALKIAHDVDSVACPFLEATEVFSDPDWRQLVLTISRGAKVAAARRRSMSEGLALALAETGDTLVTETLVENLDAPMTSPVCHSLIERCTESVWLLDKLAARDGLKAEIASKLCSVVSAAARDKLSRIYDLTDFTDPIGVEAEFASLSRLVRETSGPRLVALAQRLVRDGMLTPIFLLQVIRQGSIEFFEVALSVLSSVRVDRVQSTIRHGDRASMSDILDLAGVPSTLQKDFWAALELARTRLRSIEPDSSP